jgi:ribonuclease J
VLPAPPPRNVRLVPLGGLGEIGMNCLAIEQGSDILVVDCGIQFPHDDLGVDVVHPDFTWLVERADRVRGVFITHGHEDHIGALPYLLDRMDVPVWGPPHALGLVRHRLEEHDFRANDCDLRVAQPGSTYSVGGFEVEPVRVAHSIVEASALRIGTDAGTIVHTGDFNFDDDPPDGEPTDEVRLAALAREGVALLLSDSTNVDVLQKGVGERAVGEALHAIVRQATGRVFIALFASNIQRLRLLGDIAVATGRRICVLGRSLTTQLEIATNIGRLAWPSNLRIGTDEARTAPPGKVLVLAGGTQGESGSAMARLAAGTHGELAIEPEDTVIFSSRIIPGNDVPVSRMMGDVMRRTAHIHTRQTDPGVHTSGHATRPEQAKMIDLVQPRCFLPVHGTLHHLQRHAELARERGVADVRVIENGTAVLCDGRAISIDGRVPNGAVPVGAGGVELGRTVLLERAELARTGLATVAIALDRRGALVGSPAVTVRGVAGTEDPAELRALTAAVVRAVEAARRRRMSQDELREEVRRSVRRRLLDVGGVRPVVEVLVLDQDGR